MVPRLASSLLFLLAFIVWARAEIELNEESAEDELFEGKPLSWKEDDGLEVKILKPIKAEDCKLRSRPGDIIQQYYRLEDKDGKEIGSNFGGKPYKFTIGKGQVVPGMDRAMVGMCVGEKRSIIIPGKLGFGKHGREHDKIASDQTLYYTIELLNLFRPVPGKSWTTDEGVKIKVVHQIDEKKCRLSKVGDTIHQHYTLWLEDGNMVDTSRNAEEPFVFKLGANEVVKGMDISMLGMCEGERRQLTIPPALGYGTKGSLPKVPANATLYFEVELVKLIKQNDEL